MSKKSAATRTEGTEVISYKGFDQDLKCRGFQYKVGETYEHGSEVEACASGFHACEHPLNIFQYYPPAISRFAAVRQSGKLSRHPDDTKVASERITIEAELSLPELIERAVKWVFDRANWKDGPVCNGDNEGATASGTQGAATASGHQGAATASRHQGAATASGYQGAATASGTHGAATASGTQGAVKAEKNGCALFLVYRDPVNGEILHAWAGISGREEIRSGVWYRLNADGQPVEIVSP